MSTQPPPGRYRVVEKGRRLMVIDTLTGEAATRAPPPPPPPASYSATAIDEMPAATVPGGADRTVFDGGMRLKTIRLYDLKGPRTVVIDAAGVKQLSDTRGWLIAGAVFVIGLLFLFPILFIPLAIAAFNPKINGKPRQRITAWLDRYESR